MKHINYKTKNTCSSSLEFDLTDDLLIQNLKFHGGCQGNLSAISILVNNKSAMEVCQLLENIRCGLKSTSCAAQLAIAIKEALHD